MIPLHSTFPTKLMFITDFHLHPYKVDFCDQAGNESWKVNYIIISQECALFLAGIENV